MQLQGQGRGRQAVQANGRQANVRQVNGNNNIMAPLRLPQNYVDPTAKLGKPRTLLLLWHEWIHGNDGNKAASNFTEVEKGKVKFAYCRRMNFWSVIVRLINMGHNELSAIDLIRQCYGRNESVTAILKALCKAKTEGYHPNLNLTDDDYNNRGARMRDRRHT